MACLEMEELTTLGRILDTPLERLDGQTPGIFLAETLLRIRARDGRSLPLCPNPVQAEFERRRGMRNIVLKARQMGLSTWIAGRFFLKTITQPGTFTLQVAHTQEAAEDLFRMVHRFYGGLPEPLRKGPLKTARANVRSLVFPRIDSEYRVETAGDRNAGRGLTVQNLHCSELARWPGDAAAVLAGLRAAQPPQAELVLESTAQGAYGCFHDEWMRAEEQDGAGMVRHFFPWWWEQAYVLAQDGPEAGNLGEARSLDKEEAALVEKHGLSPEQIRFRRGLQRQFGRMMQQEYPESADACFLASGECVFDVAAIDRRLAKVPEPVARRWNGGLEIWYPALASKGYVVTVDPAGGGSEGDYCAMQVVELSTGLQCAEYRGRLGLLEIAQRAAELAREYGRALLVVERNNHGHAVLAYLRSVCGYAPLYAQDGLDGWLTTSLTRPALLQGFGRVLVEQPAVLNSRRLLRECRSFVRDERGRMAAAQGEHDDCLMAMGMALAVRGQTME